MLRAITKRLRRDKRGISNVIVVMLSLVLIVIIVGNVILWSYQMNQLDLERMQESLTITSLKRITHSSWFTAKNEFSVSAGSRLSGAYTDTTTLDSVHETFIEERAQIFHPSRYVPGGFTSYVSGSIPDLNLNDDIHMRFRSYPNYESRYQESLEESSTTSTTYQDKVSISFTPQITTNYVIIATAEVRGASTAYHAKAQLVVNAATHQELRYRVKDVTDWYPFCGLKYLNLAGGANYEVKIQFCTNNAAGTAYIRNARIIVLSLQSEYAESEELSTTNSIDWQDKVTLAFTPPSSGDYLVIATANYRGSSTSRDVKIRLIQDGAIIHSETIGRPGSGTTANYYTFGVMRKLTLDAAPHNLKIQYCSSNSQGVSGINYAHIAAIRLDQFDESHYVEDEDESSPSAINVWNEKVANTYTADDGDYVIIGSISYRSGSAANSVGLDFQTESTSRQSPTIEQRSQDGYETAFFMTKQTNVAGSKEDRIMWMGESLNARVKNARLISCRLPIPKQIVDVEFFGNSNTQDWTKLEWAIDSSFTTTEVATTFQLYDYSTNQYPASGDGYISDKIGSTDVTENGTITDAPANFRDAEGNWRIRIRGVKATDMQFELKVDWVEFKATTSDMYRLCISNNFVIDLSTYPLNYIHGIEILVRYNVTEDAEKWLLKAYNWATSSFSDTGFNITGGSQPVQSEWNDYAVSLTDSWTDYVRDDGTLLVEFFDEGLSMNQTMVGVDFFGVRAIVDGACVELKNSSPLTVHVVAAWIINSTSHQRYDADLFINSGEEASYTRIDVSLPRSNFVAKVVTERGNVAVFTGS